MRNFEANHEAMKIYLKSIRLSNFKSHQNLSVNFGECTEITGGNEKGKSSISEGVTWTLYGTSMFGNKLDPTPTTYEVDHTAASLLLNVDGKDLLLGRELKNGKAKYIINEVPSKAGEFTGVLEQMFDRDLFLSLFNPNYFFTMHWQKQREMVLQYITAPANKAVFKEMPKKQSEKLAELVKKHSLDDVEKIHREKKPKLEKDHIAIKSRVQTLKEQLGAIGSIVPMSSLNLEKKRIDDELAEIDTEAAEKTNALIQSLNARIEPLRKHIATSAKEWPKIKDQPIPESCNTCGQHLPEEAIKRYQEGLDKQKETFRNNHAVMVADRKQLESELAKLEPVDISEQMNKKIELNAKLHEIKYEISKHESLEQAKKFHNEAVQSEKDTLKELNESIFIIDSIKAFYAKKAELQAEKVQALFENLSIKLYKDLKNGEQDPAFIITKDGVAFEDFSKSGKVRAGLEIRNVLSQQSNIITPVFLDDAESVEYFKEPNGQLIIGRVVAGQELKIEQLQEEVTNG